MVTSQSKLISVITNITLFSIGLLIYFKFANSAPVPIFVSSLVGIFEQYTFTHVGKDGKVKFLQHNFTTGETKELTVINTIYNPDVKLIGHKIFYIATIEGIKDSGNLGNCIVARLGIIKCPNNFEFFDVPSKTHNKIAENITSFASSQSSNKAVYVKFDGKKNEVFIYDISSRITHIKGTYRGAEILLLKLTDHNEIVLSQNEKLYRLREQSAKPEMIYDPKVTKGELVNYTLLKNGDTLLLEKATQKQGIIFETGVFDLKSGQYFSLEEGDIMDSRLAILSSSSTKEAIELYKNLTGGNIYNNSAQALAFTPDRKHLLFRKVEFINRRGKVTFSIEPLDKTQSLTIEKEKADGNEPIVYFLGWIN